MKMPNIFSQFFQTDIHLPKTIRQSKSKRKLRDLQYFRPKKIFPA